MASISIFLRTGNLGPIGLGTKKSVVHEYLGEPNEKTVKGVRPEIWKYGDLQLAFVQGEVSFIGLYPTESELTLPEALHIEDRMITGSIRIDQFLSYLQSQGIPSRIDEMLTFDDQQCLVLDSGISVLFGNSTLDSLQLIKP